jgi:Pyruvate/2-oxoacid:ferredoxin oxidoreductase delta subunit
LQEVCPAFASTKIAIAYKDLSSEAAKKISKISTTMKKITYCWKMIVPVVRRAKIWTIGSSFTQCPDKDILWSTLQSRHRAVRDERRSVR